ncbi:MAG: hypothetical protein ACTSVD_09195 [Candidatus Thorarchaeota archaeon]|nr:MAG: hypothetical protein DRO73_06380 [Candidatus Thorarchaeota archaeon]RLI58636.1 MAG: hypothetical protein DRO93_09520 [Candidatus Thorarchaeota archaeon]
MRIDDMFPETGVLPAVAVVFVVALALEMTGVWLMMLVAGAFAALFTRRAIASFLAGATGVGMAWLAIFVYLIATAHALEVAEFFAGLLGLTGAGTAVIAVSVLIGSLLGGCGAFRTRLLIEVWDSSESTTAEDLAHQDRG